MRENIFQNQAYVALPVKLNNVKTNSLKIKALDNDIIIDKITILITMINMRKCRQIMMLFTSCLLLSCSSKNEYYVKHVKFPDKATLEEKVDMASRLVPTSQQLEWQSLELTAFIHFGINTFTGREWGTGKEDPKLFNPTEFNAEQWVSILKNSGFKMVIITAKHHDGFCLWPTNTTKHSVAYSSWKDGTGDVVREVRNACYKYDMKFGVYLSPWDRNAPSYGDSPAYNKLFRNQLTELLSNYGEVHEVWFDGANGEGPNGKKQVYDWEPVFEIIHTLQPKAVTAIMGDDVRWVGNENGLGRETEWGATVITPNSYPRARINNKRLDINSTAKDLGSREMLAKANELFWYPSEVDVSIRPGWFYHESEDTKVKTLKQLVNIYFQSVGRNSVLLLNIPPDKRGLINENDELRLNEFKRYIDKMYSENYVTDFQGLWKAEEGDSKILSLKDNSEINVLVIQENISEGQRIESFNIDIKTETGWKNIVKGTTVGYKRIFRVDGFMSDKLRVTINQTRGDFANVCNVAAYYADEFENANTKNVINDIPRDKWKIISDNPFVIDLGNSYEVNSLIYAPSSGKNNLVFKYDLYVSNDGLEWIEIKKNAEFGNIVNNPVPQTITFAKSEFIRFVKINATSMEGTNSSIDLKEIGIKIKK